MNRIITIGREFGSGGRELGRKLAEILGFEFYDKEIITEIAKKTSLSENYVHQVVEKNPHDLFPITVAHTFSYVDAHALEKKQAVYSEQENVLKEMANNSDCIIVGRCADYILKDYKPLKIFVYSDMQSKIKRCIDRNAEHDLTEKKVKKYIKSVNKSRAKYYHFYTGKRWAEKHNYDIMLNTTGMNIEHLAHSIAALIKAD